MQKTSLKNMLSVILCIVLIAAMALFVTGCNNTQTESSEPSVTGVSSIETKVMGEGSTKFDFAVTDKDGKETKFEIHTDKAKVGDALIELGLIAGDESTYGLYVKTVNGQTLDYDTDGKYWAFYVDGQYASTGVDTTDITKGTSYSFKAEKG